jgi:hypothetical protein|tara:strand:- start:107 stop:289 length:183 start_codon:yes stop_codon:yes gene_type:complete
MKKLNAKQKAEIKELKNDVILLSNFIDKWCTVNTIGMTLNEYQDYVLVKQILRERAKILC